MNFLQIISLPKITDPRGNLTFIEELKHIPFQIARAYWVYDVPGGETRGSHAFKEQHEIIVALSGSFDIVVHDGGKEQRFTLNRSYQGLYLPPMTWRTVENFSTNSAYLVLSSHHFDANDYIRDFEVFISASKEYNNTDSEAAQTIVGQKSAATTALATTTIDDCKTIHLPRVVAGNGHLTIVEGDNTIPYDIKRAYYLYDIPASSERGAHAHKKCHRFLVAISGSFDVELDDGVNKKTVRLDRPFYGLYVAPGVWTAIDSFSGGSICLSLASELYSEDDYIREYDEYQEYRNV